MPAYLSLLSYNYIGMYKAIIKLLVPCMYNIIGSAPIDLLLSQISTSGMISVSWTPPPAPPSDGYQITVDSEDFSAAGVDTLSSSQVISVSFGVHTIRVQSRSIHFSGGIAAMDITVLGIKGRCIILLY